MKKSVIAVALIGTALLTSCFGTNGMATGSNAGASVPRPSAATNSPTATTAATTTPAQTTGTTAAGTTAASGSNTQSALGNLLGGVASGNTSNLLGSILGAFGATTNANTIVGTWTYKEPSIQFESTNFLAQAGGVVASQSMVKKLTPYYEKVGLKAGVASITLNANNSCAIVLSNRTINGTYTYNAQNGTITVNGSTGIKLFTAYASVSLSQLALTLDTSNLLNLLKNVGANSGNSTLSGISGISSSFNGMKTGFLFVK